jgi:hypothetical protein
MTNGSGPDHCDNRKTVEGKKSSKRSKKAAADAAKQTSATKRAQ